MAAPRPLGAAFLSAAFEWCSWTRQRSAEAAAAATHTSPSVQNNPVETKRLGQRVCVTTTSQAAHARSRIELFFFFFLKEKQAAPAPLRSISHNLWVRSRAGLAGAGRRFSPRMYGNTGGTAPACLPVHRGEFCLCVPAAKFLSGGAPKRNCRLLSTVSYALSLRTSGLYCVQYRVVLYSYAQIRGGLFINFSAHTHTHTHIPQIYWFCGLKK